MSDLPDYAQSVSIDAANVTIPISGAVTIAAGSVTIANASIAVINASGTQIAANIPNQFLVQVAPGNGVDQTTNVAVPPGTQAIALDTAGGGVASFTHVKAVGHVSTVVYFEAFVITQPIQVFPVLPRDTSIDVTVRAVSAGFGYDVSAIFQPNPLLLEFYAPPFAEPNQAPIFTAKSLASGVAQWLIIPTANVRITIFNFTLSYFTNAGAGDQWYVAHGAALPGAGVFPANAAVLASGGTAGAWPFNYPLGGSELPRGDGIYAEVTLSAAANLGSVITSSLD